MKVASKTHADLQKKVEDLHGRLKEAEEQLRIYRKDETVPLPARKLARFILDQSTEVILICDNTGTIMRTSQMAHRFFTNRLLGRRFDTVCPFTLTKSAPYQTKQFSVSSVLGGKIFRSQEVTYRQDDGRVLYFLLSARPLSDGKDILGCLITLTDITERKEAEREREQLRIEAENERRRLEAIMEALPVGVAITDAYGGNIRANRAFEQVWGSPRLAATSVSDYAAHKAWWADTGEPVAPEEWASAQALQKDQAVIEQMLEIERFDGSRVFVLNSASPVRDASGKVIGSAVALMNITAHREAEMKYSKILATTLNGFWISDRQGRLLEVNEALCRMLGYPREELLALSIANFEAAESPADVLNHITALQQKKFDFFVSRHRRKDGSIIDVEVNSTWLDIGEGYVVGFMHDITERKRAEEALRTSLERYRSYIEITGGLGWTTNAAGEVVEDIPSFRKFTGQTEEEVKGWGWSKALHPDDLERTTQVWRQAVKSKSNYEVEYRLRRHDGIYRYFLARGTPVFKEDGSVREWVGICIDITERKRMEEDLRKSRDELEIRVQERTKEVREQSRVLDSFFKFTITPFIILDKDFNFIRVNEAYAKACQREESDFLGHNHFEFYPHEENEAIFRRVVETKVPYQTFAKPFSFPDHPEWGTTFWDWTLTPLLGDRGEVEFLVFSLEDVTERVQAEEALRAAHQYNRGLIEASLDPLVTIDPEGKVTDVNSATELATGVPREQLVGSDFSDYFVDPDKAREGYRQVFAKGTVRDYPLAIRHTSGMITDVLYNATLYRNEAGKVQGVFASARDVTELNEAHALTEATNSLLNLFVRRSTRKEYLDSAIELIRPWSGCRCVGIRILNEKDYIPFESYVGFDREFWESENLLSVKYDQCACIRVVAGNPDPQDRPVMTSAGSFRCENTFEFVGSLSDEEKTRFRGVCMKNGFKSVAIVPIRYRDKIVGAIHIADENEGKVPISRVQFIESIAPLIGEAINRFSLEEQLKDSEKRLRYLSSQLLTAQESERKRIALELHDSIGQMLTAIKFKAENYLQEREKSGTKDPSFEAIISMIKETIEEVRRMQMDLRPSTLDDLGVLATLAWFCREYQKVYSRIRIDKEITIHEDEVSTPLKVVVYRLTQEAMNNIAKHSRADLVRLSLRKQENKIEWAIEDNGMGFDLETILSSSEPRKGLGLSSMRERTELSGGTFLIESTQGKGTTLRASWPL